MSTVIPWVVAANLLCSSAAGLPQPAPVDEYAIHEDGGLIYDPLRREAESTGQLARYSRVPTVTQDLQVGAYSLQLRVPRKATAYDVVPIRYRLSWTYDPSPESPVAVEATAFEEEKRRKGRDLFDLALPGRLDASVEYLGSITADFQPGKRNLMQPDFTDKPGQYPPFRRKRMARSGVVQAGDLVWFKFRITNTGDTILDAEGAGGYQFFPELYRKSAAGGYEFAGFPYNLYVRDLEYLYPGESRDIWVQFASNTQTPQGFGLTPGEYKIHMRMTYRCYKDFDAFLNIWEGPLMYVYEMPFAVETEGRDAPVAEGKVTLTDGGDPDKITRWIHTFEEFMTAFDCHITRSKSRSPIEGTLYLQVAPWTQHVVLKLITASPVAIASVAVPIEVDSKSLAIRFNHDHHGCIVKNGLKEPAIHSMTMADMRTNVQFGPFPERHIRSRLREMMDCGINVVSTTSMPWLYDLGRRPSGEAPGVRSNNQGDALKYFLDVAREEGMLVEGWGTYPFCGSRTGDVAAWVTSTPPALSKTGGGEPSNSDPKLPWANAMVWLYQFARWGDLFAQTAEGDVPIGLEDTRGWMRQDVQVRLPMGELTVKGFKDWARRRYGSIEAANAAWGSGYASFDEIDPEAGQSTNQFGHSWEYTDPKHLFHDWNQAVADLDEYRTGERIRNYRDTLDIVRKEIPNATIALRTEGGNFLAGGVDPETPNSHLRHVYYSQRRQGMIAEMIGRSGLVKYHSDYITLPYTPTELRELVGATVRLGIVPIHMPQFDNMRDIAINARYGTDYQFHYNLPAPRKGAMMHVLTAVYPWFKAVYESGGIPGILWEDYQCDGFATVTQKREMRLFRRKLQEALNTPEALEARRTKDGGPSQEWRKKSRAMRSYR